jgi:hypothetical protein
MVELLNGSPLTSGSLVCVEALLETSAGATLFSLYGGLQLSNSRTKSGLIAFRTEDLRAMWLIE